MHNILYYNINYYKISDYNIYYFKIGFIHKKMIKINSKCKLQNKYNILFINNKSKCL